MLEIINAPGHIRQGEAKLEFSTARQGRITFIKGVNSAGEVVLACPMNSAQALVSYYPIKKYRMEEDLSDTSAAVDQLSWNDRVVYYEGGEFWTDQFDRDSIDFGRAVPAATAAYRGLYGIDVSIGTARPTALCYVQYGTSDATNAGRLSLNIMATAAIIDEYGLNRSPFRFMEAHAHSASGIDYGTGIKVRFKISPGYVGQVI